MPRRAENQRSRWPAAPLLGLDEASNPSVSALTEAFATVLHSAVRQQRFVHANSSPSPGIRSRLPARRPAGSSPCGGEVSHPCRSETTGSGEELAAGRTVTHTCSSPLSRQSAVLRFGQL